jgi:hypothetical protein
VETHLPHLRPAQHRSLALWVTGTLLAGRSSQSAVLTALEPLLPGTPRNTLRQHLREGLREGADKAAPCQVTLDVTTCFAPLLRWILTYWHGDHLALALDATTLADRVVVLCLSVLYRGSAIPIAWRILPANQRGPWLPHLLALVTDVADVIPSTMTVLVLTDRGLWSPRLWQQIRDLGWHPLQRLRPDVTFCPDGARRGLARALVSGPGQAWVGTGTAFKHTGVKRAGTLIVCWGEDEAEPWICLTDLPPEQVGVAWYGLRTWIELGFRFLKRGGWDWQHTRRTDPARIARHLLVVAIATLITALVGTRVEDAAVRGRLPHAIRVATPPPARRQRQVAVLVRGLATVRVLLLRGRGLWQRLWLWPDPWPDPPAHLLGSTFRLTHPHAPG